MNRMHMKVEETKGNGTVSPFLELLDSEEWDQWMEKIAGTMFKVIMIAGVPYFLYVMSQFVF